MGFPSLHAAGVRALGLALGILSLAAGDARAAETKSACDQAIERWDKTYTDRGDDQALAAANALEKGPCAKPDAARARAVSRQGMVQFHRHDVVEASVAFEAAVELNPKDPILRMSACGTLTELERYEDAIAMCEGGYELAKSQDDGSAAKHENVVMLGFNLALAKARRGRNSCGDRTIYEMFEAYRAAHPDHASVHQLLGGWVWDCDDDFDRGFALYKKSCALGQEAACEQVRYTEACRCETRQPD